MQAAFRSPLWNIVYSTIIILLAIFLSHDKWDTSDLARTVYLLYYAGAQLFFCVELIALWITRDGNDVPRFTQIVPYADPSLEGSPKRDPSETQVSPNGDPRESQGSPTGEASRQDTAGGTSDQAHQYATIIFKVFLLFTGAAGVVTGDRYWTHTQALRIFWPAVLVLPVLRTLLHSSLTALRAVSNIVLFIFVFTLCFAITGRYVFGDSLNEISRMNFASLSSSMLILFQLFSGDSWTLVLYKVLESEDGRSYYQQWLGGLFIIVWFLFSKVIMTNLLVSVIVDSFNVTATVENVRNSGGVFGAWFTKKSKSGTGRSRTHIRYL